MIVGYHAAGLLYHDPVDAIGMIADLGYESVAIRPHGATLNPRSASFGQQLVRIGDAIHRSGLKCVLDLDAPFLPDLQSARGPALVSSEPATAVAARMWITTWIEASGELRADLLTFSSGTWDAAGEKPEEAMLERLTEQFHLLTAEAARQGCRLAIHPRHGDAVSTVAQFERLRQWIDDDETMLLAADIGEMLAGGELPLADRLARNLDKLACLYLNDRRAGAGGDQRIGHGDVALGRILQALESHRYQGHVIARVEGHCELGFTPAREAIQILKRGEG